MELGRKIAFDQAGNLYSIDPGAGTGAIYRLSPNSALLLSGENAKAAKTTLQSNACAAQWQCVGLTADPQGNLF